MYVGSTWTQRASSFLQYKKVYTCHGHHVNGKAIMGGGRGGGDNITYTNYKLGVVTFLDKVRAPIGKVVVRFELVL